MQYYSVYFETVSGVEKIKKLKEFHKNFQVDKTTVEIIKEGNFRLSYSKQVRNKVKEYVFEKFDTTPTPLPHWQFVKQTSIYHLVASSKW